MKIRTDNKQSVKFIDLLNKDERKKYVKYLNGNIIISHCKEHNTFILLFDFKRFDAVYRRLLSKNFLFRQLKELLILKRWAVVFPLNELK